LSLFPIRCRFWLCQPTFSSLKSGLSEVLLFLLQGSQADNPNSPIDKEIRRSVVGFRKTQSLPIKCCCLVVPATSVATLATTLRSALPLSVSATTVSRPCSLAAYSLRLIC
ncbi:hypothetical protein ASPTUDRAFT_183882, partial [Aspergillus tubingensis CBS 134.48]